MFQDDLPGRPPQLPYARLGHRTATYVGLPKDEWRDIYHLLLTMPNLAFLGAMAVAYAAINAVFGGLYMLDPAGVSGARPTDFWDFFFFSVQTLAGVGYGQMWPRSLFANGVATAESFVGLFNLGVATGLLFARISRPTARIMFSKLAVVAPLNGSPTLMFRTANRRQNRIVEAEVSVTLIHDVVTLEGQTLRRFDELPVLRAKSPLFILTWQVMHVIDESSPLFGETTESLLAKKAEILVVMKGLDETFVSTIHARTSYLPFEIIWGRRLVDMFSMSEDGVRTIDFRRFHDIV